MSVELAPLSRRSLPAAAVTLLRDLGSSWRIALSLWRNQTAARYAGSAAGAVWAVVAPLALIVVYTAIFSALVKGRVPGLPEGAGGFGLYFFAGMLPWMLVAQSLQAAPSCLLNNGPALRRFLLQPCVVPATVVLAALTDMLATCGIYLAAVAALRHLEPLRLLVLPPALLMLGLMSLGLALAISALNLYGRDVSHAVSAFLPFWFFATPVAYPAQALPETLQLVLAANPLTGFVELFRWALLLCPLPSPVTLAWSAFFSAACFVVGAWVFEETRPDFVDLL